MAVVDIGLVPVALGVVLLGTQPVVEALIEGAASVAELDVAGIVAPHPDRQPAALLAAPAGDDVDHAPHRLVAKQHPGAPLQDLDALHVFEGDGGEVRLRQIGVVEAATVEEDQGILPGGQAPHRDAHVAAVADTVPHLQGTLPPQRLVNGAGRAQGDVVRADHPHPQRYPVETVGGAGRGDHHLVLDLGGRQGGARGNGQGQGGIQQLGIHDSPRTEPANTRIEGGVNVARAGRGRRTTTDKALRSIVAATSSGRFRACSLRCSPLRGQRWRCPGQPRSCPGRTTLPV